MRTFLFVSLILISHVMVAQRYSSFIKDRPIRPQVVNDYANLLSSYQEKTLEEKLIAYRQRSGNAIVIIILSTLNDRSTGTSWSIEDAALQYFNKWGIGGSYSNRGVLILVSEDPRRVRITTGIGIEAILTNDDCQRIIDETIVPSFKSGSFYTGLNEGINDIKTVLWSGSQSRPHNRVQEENQTQEAAVPQPQTQTPPQRETMTYGPDNIEEESTPLRPIIWGIILFVVAVWLRIRYVKKKRPDAEVYSAEGSSGASSDNIHPVAEFFIAIAWVLWGAIKIAFGIFILVFAFFGRRSRGAGSSSGAGASFDGGRSNGGGASGSW